MEWTSPNWWFSTVALAIAINIVSTFLYRKIETWAQGRPARRAASLERSRKHDAREFARLRRLKASAELREYTFQQVQMSLLQYAVFFIFCMIALNGITNDFRVDENLWWRTDLARRIILTFAATIAVLSFLVFWWRAVLFRQDLLDLENFDAYEAKYIDKYGEVPQEHANAAGQDNATYQDDSIQG